MTFEWGSGGDVVSWSFPKSYNVGNYVEGGSGPAAPSATRQVKIFGKAIDTNTVYVDYAFDASDLNVAGRYFVYDPTVCVGNGCTRIGYHKPADEDAGPGAAIGGSMGGLVFVGLVVFAIWWLHRQRRLAKQAAVSTGGPTQMQGVKAMGAGQVNPVAVVGRPVARM